MRDDADTVVIGAGVAGLAAAGELARVGRAVRVIEARERIGGRIFTVRQPGLELPIELGAEFVHGANSVTMCLAAEAGLLVSEVNGEHWRARDGRLERVHGFWEKVQQAMSRLDPDRQPDRPVSEALAEVAADFSEDERRLLLEYVQGFHAADPERMGERALAAAEGAGDDDADEEADRQLRIHSGYDRIAAQLALVIPDRIMLDTVAERILWSRGRVEVVTRTSNSERLTFTARAAVITVPLAVLQAPPGATGALALEPPVPRLQSAAAQLAVGSVLRLVVRLREPLWSTGKVRAPDGTSLAHLSFLHADSEIPVWWTQAPLLAPVIVGWSGGPPAAALLKRDRADIEQLARRVLAEQFRMRRADLEREIVSISWHDWQSDPFARGAYTYIPVGAIDAQRELAEPEADTLFLAGEALSAADPGTVHGAIESGIAAARRLLG